MIEPGWWIFIAVIFGWLTIPGIYLVVNKQARHGVYLLFSVYLMALLGLPIAVFVFASVLTGGIVLPLFLAIAVYLLSMAPVASRVGYKTREVFWLLFPRMGVQILLEWMWRLASLPNRYWDGPQVFPDVRDLPTNGRDSPTS
ncbi:MAG: hypothetical protein KY429_04845 [Actinobacteria bacterium]|nr:hypothetical protein [Actinomycetota bacterium]